MASGPETRRRIDELEAMPEWSRLGTVRRFSLSVEIFQENARDLIGLLDSACGPEAVALWSVENRSGLDRFQREIARRLHNFVASAMSLVDHARVFYRGHYKDQGTFTDYEAEVGSRFASEPATQFIHGLRNYYVHVGIPTISNSLNLALDGSDPHGRSTMTHTTLLDGTELRDKLNATGKAYVDRCGGTIDLRTAISSYTDRVTEFYCWMFERLNAIHAEDRRAVEAKQLEARRSMGPIVLRSLRAGLLEAAQIRFAPETLFAPFMNGKRYDAIRDANPDPERQAVAFIECVQTDFEVDLSSVRTPLIELFVRGAAESSDRRRGG